MLLRFLLVTVPLLAPASCDDTLRFHPASSPDQMCPDKQGKCPDKDTCCKLPSGKYGCCPLPNGVCCSDHQHCCPSGFTCDLAGRSCRSGSLAVDWMQKVEENDVLCPGKKSTCPNGSTCCSIGEEKFGCCPFPVATCCSDKQHCCPHGYKCDPKDGSCRKGSKAGSIEWLRLVAAIKEKKASPSSSPLSAFTSPAEIGPNPLCPDETSTCPKGSTCCIMPNGQYGCCPMPDAVCCEDHLHCCPEGTTCDVKKPACNRDGYAFPIFKKFAAERVEGVICPDGQSVCPDSNTCCLLASGEYGCCPMPHAVCCTDHLHCCPNGNTCDLKTASCIHGTASSPWQQKQPSRPLPEKFSKEGADSVFEFKDEVQLSVELAAERERVEVTCGDKVSTCPAGTTCCEMQSGYYGCCPMENAKCCPDHLHCCAADETCDVSHGTCTKDGVSSPLRRKLPATRRTPPPPTVAPPPAEKMCADNISTCPVDTTCCEMQSGYYGCCPMENAQCCADKLHCCPSDETCDNERGICVKTDSAPADSVTALKLTTGTVSDVECPDKKGTCPEGSTCCLMESGEYGCCPYEKAVCCSDHKTCCPSGYTCNAQTKMCDPTSPRALLRPQPATPITAAAGVVVCPGGESACPDGSTCCMTTTGQYGCCPAPDAVCCADKIHCCPEGYKCESGGCSKGGQASVPWAEKLPATPVDSQEVKGHEEEVRGRETCGDQKSMCDDGQTCCKLRSGEYGCCPMEHAVCCSDGVHCCPSGTQCDLEHQRCSGAKSNILVSWTFVRRTLLFAPKVSEVKDEVKDVPVRANVCPDKTECPKGTTCCEKSSGKFACCPEQNATCCPDKVHCCPSGYSCDPEGGACKKPGVSLDWLLLPRLPSAQPQPQEAPEAQKAVKYQTAEHKEAVMCPDRKHQCPTFSTCCLLQSGGWGCCPYRQAKCCEDQLHCCPQGYECDGRGRRCVKGTVSVSWELFSRNRAAMVTP